MARDIRTGRFKTAGLAGNIRDAFKKRKAERRINKMFDVPQGVDRRKKDRRLSMPTHKI